MEYFDSTYVTGSFRRIQRLNGVERLHIRRRPPTFLQELWNVHDLTLQNDDRTNNFCEAWNHGFSKIVGHSHPSVWKLIQCLQEDEAQTRMLILQNARGQPPVKRVRRVTRDLQERLHNLCRARATGEKTIEEFLRGIGHCIRLG